jgi:hypothetical protein
MSGMTAPTPAGTCDNSAANIASAHANLNPGTYCSISISNTGTGSLTLNPGTYIMSSGNFTVTGGTVIANGVTIYFPSTSPGGINVTGGNFTLTAPSGGSMDGIAVWEAGTGNGTITGVCSGCTATFGGVIYMPKAHLDLTGGTGTMLGTLVVDTMTVTGGNFGGPSQSSYFNNGSTPAGVYLLPY